MKFKVGDYVKIKEGLNINNACGFVPTMKKYRGKVAKVVEVYGTRYKLDIDKEEWNWYEDMVEPVQAKTYNITIAGDTVIVKDIKGNTGIAKCSPEDEFDLATGISLAIERLRWKPSLSEYYWTVEFGSPSLIYKHLWNNDSVDNMHFKNGVVFKTKEEAMKTAKKMLEVV